MFLAESLIDVGHLEQARTHLETGNAHREAYGECVVAAELERVEAELLRAEGAPAQCVEVQLNKAIDTARGQGARLFELRAANSLARLWRDEGRRAEAHALLAPIYAWFTEGFNTRDLREAKVLLDELAGPC
jgi:predicted ATPase